MIKIKRLLLSLSIAASSCIYIPAWSAPHVSDPLKFQMPVTPSVLNSDEEAKMDYSSLNQSVSDMKYLVSCNVVTHTNNDPLYFITPTEGGPEIDGPVDVDGQQSPNPREAYIASSGNHIITFPLHFVASQRLSSCTNCNFPVHNASNDVINITNCYAILNY